MNHKKRFLPLLVSSLLLLSACGGQAGTSSSQDEPADQADALLATIPYFGDSTKCVMSAQQATEYAKLIRDGMAGQLALGSGYSEILTTPYWEKGFTVGGYGGHYESDRAKVILGDFAGDGNPYLYVFSSRVDGDSFDVYGWCDDIAFHVAGEESWQGRQGSSLYETKDGTVEMITGGSGGAGSHYSSIIAFNSGSAAQAHTYSEVWDYDRNCMIVSEDGAETCYTEEEWEALSAEYNTPNESAAERELPFDAFSDVTARACTLREMVDFLNAYAAALSGGTAEPVELPEPLTDSEQQKAARAMLDVLDNTYDATYARLVDLDGDGDGAAELLLARGFDCTAYQWKDGALQEIMLHQGLGMTDTLTLVRNQRGAYGICANSNTDGDFYDYIFLSGITDRFQILWEEREENEFTTIYTVNGETVSEDEFSAMINCYETVETIYNYNGTTADHVDETIQSLRALL